MGAIHDKLNDDWFNNTSEDEDDLERILDYLEPRSYDGFIDLDDEAYNKKRCKLLGMTYEEPTPILIEKVKVTRYTIGPGEIYTKLKVLGVDEIPRNRDNVAAMRARLMEKMANGEMAKQIRSIYKEVEFEKPSRDFTHSIGPPSGLKGLLHMLNATVIPTKTLVNELCGYVLWKPSRDFTRSTWATKWFKRLVAYAKCNRDSYEIITEYLVNISKRRAFRSLNEDILKINDSDYQYAISIKEDTAYPCLHSQKTTKETSPIRRIQERQYAVLKIMDDPNITMEENIRLEEEKAQKHGKVFNWESAKYDKIWYDEDIHDLRSVETEFPAIAFNDGDLKTASENDSERAMPSLPSPEPTVSNFDDLDFFKDFENEFPAIVYNDAQMSKSDLLTEPILNPQHIDEFDLNDETLVSEYDEEEQNILYFNDLFPFNIIHPDDLKSEKDNDDNKIDIIQSSGGINTAYPGEWIWRIDFLYNFREIDEYWWRIYKSGDLEVLES
ncbi:hypothetical protein Tco_1253538 [Tanacetum coccineum]